MQQQEITVVQGPIVEEEVLYTLIELCQACNTKEKHVIAWVFEGVLEPIGESPKEWRFRGECLRRAQMAWRLSHDLKMNPPGVALALDLLDEIAILRRRLRCAGIQD